MNKYFYLLTEVTENGLLTEPINLNFTKAFSSKKILASCWYCESTKSSTLIFSANNFFIKAILFGLLLYLILVILNCLSLLHKKDIFTS